MFHLIANYSIYYFEVTLRVFNFLEGTLPVYFDKQFFVRDLPVKTRVTELSKWLKPWCCEVSRQTLLIM